MPKLRILSVFSAVWLAATAAARAERLPLRVYGPEEGLRTSQVLHVSVDSRGFVWVATRDGMSRFDGARFVNYGSEHGLPHPTVNHIVESRRGGYWIATNGGGVCWLDPEAALGGQNGHRLFRVLHVGDGERSNWVNVVMEDRDGRLWAGTDGGLYVLDDPVSPEPSFRRVGLPLPEDRRPPIGIYSIVEDAEGSLWIGTTGTTFALVRRLPDGRMIRYVLPATNTTSGVVALAGVDGRLWIARGATLLVIQPQPASSVAPGLTVADVRPWISTQHRLDAPIVALHRSERGAWVGTLRGLIALDGARQARYTIAHGLVDDKIVSLAEDGSGNLWIGTVAGGIMRLARGGFTTYDDVDGLGRADIHSLILDAAGRPHAVNDNWVVNRYDGQGFTAVRPRPPGRTGEYASQFAFLDRGGRWWLMSRGGLGVYPRASRLEDLQDLPPAAIYTERDGLPGPGVFRMFEDSRGHLWLSSKGPPGLARRDVTTGKFHRYTEADGFPARRSPSAFCEDPTGAVWIGFYEGGAVRYRSQAFTPISGVPLGTITDMHCDAAGRVWLASSQQGLARLEDPAAASPRIGARYTTEQGLGSNNVRALVTDRMGRLYAGTVGGVDRLDPSSGHVRQYSTSDGLASASVTAALMDREGALWFGTRRGLSRLMPERERPLPPAPVWIDSVRIAGSRRPLPHLGQQVVRGVRLEPGVRHLEIAFFGLGAGRPLTYQHRLTGADEEWGPPTTDRTIHYSRLAPGSYRFEVRALNAGGVASDVPARLEFIVVPPVWERWWFRALALATVALLAYGFHRYRVARIVAVERVRTRIAADLHDDLGGSLSRIAIQSEVARREASSGVAEAAGRLGEIAETARGLVEALGDIVWSVDPRQDDLAAVARRVRQHASDVLTDDGVRWEFKAPADLAIVKLDPEARRHLYLLLKEGVSNVARHAGARTASLRLDPAGGELRVELWDDGRGFVPKMVEGDWRRGGQGLRSMRERAARLGAHLAVESAPGRGTRLRLTIPLRMPRTTAIRPGGA